MKNNKKPISKLFPLPSPLSTLFPFLLLAVLVLLFHWRLLLPAGRQSYPPGDFVAQFWAFATFEARELSAGRLPLWNPYTYAGSPFWADAQSAVLYPFSLLTLALSGLSGGFSLFALELEAIFHFWLAGSFMYLFARRVTQSAWGGMVAALVFTFGGYLTGYPSQQLAVLEVDVWLPLLLFFTDRAFVERRPGGDVSLRPRPLWREVTFAGGAWGLALLAGHPQSWMLVGYTLVAYWVCLVFDWRASRGRLLAALRPLLAIVGLGAALAAVQLLPAVEYTRLSVRAEGVYDKMAGGFPLLDVIQVLLPGVVSHYSPLYVGGVGLLLALLAVFWRPHRFTTFWGIWGGLALLISFGGNTFLYAPLYLLGPGFSLFRGQERWAFVVAFSAAVLAGYGATQLARRPPAFVRLAGGLWLGSLGLVAAFFYGLNYTGWSAESPFYNLLDRAVFLAIVLGLAWAVIRVANRLPTPYPALALSALLLFDLFSVNWQTNLYPQPPEWHTQKPPAVAAIEADAAAGGEGLFRVYNEFRLFDNYGVPFRLQDLWGASPLRLARYDAFLAPPMRIERAWAMLNVRYVITWRETLYAPSTILYREAAEDGTTYVHRLAETGPRAWLVHEVERVPEGAMVARLTDPAFDFRRVALVSPGEAVGALSPPEGEATDRAAVVSFRPDRLAVEVEAASDALLVLSEVDYPGWRATVDGEPAPILRVDSILRAVPVPAGSHRVVMRFVPGTFWLGAGVSGLAAIWLAVTGVAALRRRKPA